MVETFKDVLWKNFGAAIDMLGDSISLCPDSLWQSEKKFFYLSYHTLIFLDYYLTIPARDFKPFLPFTLVPMESLPQDAVDDVIPNAAYKREEMLDYLSTIREKCKKLILDSSEEKLKMKWIAKEEINLHGLCPSLVEDYSVIEILFYNLRHVQHHVAQLNLILRQKINAAPDWVSHSD
ncbi:DinB family protein [Aquiflexum sp. LQ15W]|uniref:DinB family protein n=1 Tax=Cognataquiflexum nitidum TaxID=2922272 RepID=UPI001F12A132|nr:DinB family protein [Cognataquiflexum nitidum]MCH6199572.1 DinB family protein [Cognataquiflexum nitidum]